MAVDREEGFIDIDLEDPAIDEDRKPLPTGVGPPMRIKTAEMKKKEGSQFPYIAVMMQPETGDPKIDRRKFFTNLTLHPDMRWQLRDFCRAIGASTSRPNYKEWVDKMVRPTLGQEPSFRDPETLVNVVKSPFHSV